MTGYSPGGLNSELTLARDSAGNHLITLLILRCTVLWFVPVVPMGLSIFSKKCYIYFGRRHWVPLSHLAMHSLHNDRLHNGGPTDYNGEKEFLSPHDSWLSWCSSVAHHSHVCGDAGENTTNVLHSYKSVAQGITQSRTLIKDSQWLCYWFMYSVYNTFIIISKCIPST